MFSIELFSIFNKNVLEYLMIIVPYNPRSFHVLMVMIMIVPFNGNRDHTLNYYYSVLVSFPLN